MVQQVTEGISITVETFYQEEQSFPIHSDYFFSYKITIENLSEVPVRLLRRNWHIIDSNGNYRNIEGDGVVGIQPIITPGESYQYISSANLRSEMGKMHGHYTMENMYNKKLITVLIPSFNLIAPSKLN